MTWNEENNSLMISTFGLPALSVTQRQNGCRVKAVCELRGTFKACEHGYPAGETASIPSWTTWRLGMRAEESCLYLGWVGLFVPFSCLLFCFLFFSNFLNCSRKSAVLLWFPHLQGPIPSADRLPEMLKKTMGETLYEKISEKVLEGTKVSHFGSPIWVQNKSSWRLMIGIIITITYVIFSK